MAPPGKLFVGCLPYSKLEQDLTCLFEPFGALAEVHVLKKPDGSSKGAAFVTYQNPESIHGAMAQLQNYSFPGSTRGINISIPGVSSGASGGMAQQQPRPRQPQVAPFPGAQQWRPQHQ